MQIEIEKKYELTGYDYEIIKEKCEFIEEKDITDYYLDDDNFSLIKQHYYVRIRNGKYELKIESFNKETNLATALEYDDEEDINLQLQKFNLTIDDLSWTVVVKTKREKYKYNYKGYTFYFDMDRYQYGARYEVELLFENDEGIDGNSLIEDIRSELGLNAQKSTDGWKVVNAAMHQNISLYEVFLTQELWLKK